MRRPIATALLCLLTVDSGAGATLPEGYWDETRSSALLAQTGEITLGPDLASLTTSERRGLDELLKVGHLMQRLYVQSRHAEATEAWDALMQLHRRLGEPAGTRNLIDLYRLNQGPVATTLENRREPFLPVSPEVPGRNVYPAGVTQEELAAFMAAHPESRAGLLGERTVVRRRQSLPDDLAVLERHPLVRELHPDVLSRLRGMAEQEAGSEFYAVPYAVAYADELTQAFQALMRAATAFESSDAEFAGYLRHRARDLVANDYEAGDAAWVTGRFGRLNAQIGAYETYDDALFGTKTFHGMSLLLRDERQTERVRKALGNLQRIEDALPYQPHRRVREDISVGVYDVIADFGQARSLNTATILPNDPLATRRYGRTILLRQNILRDPTLFASSQRAWRAVTHERHADELTPEGNVQRTLWHEIGHYLGPDRDRQGRPTREALEEYGDALEEMKSDLVALFAIDRLGYPELREVQASGIRRTLQSARPREDQPYQRMQLVQFNWFLERGLIQPDPSTSRLQIDYARYRETVDSLLAEVLRLQSAGNKDDVAAFFARWTEWTPRHEEWARRIREAQGKRFWQLRYRVLDEG